MKTKPYGIRFDEDLLKKIKEKEGLKSEQAVVNFLFKWYEQTHFPIAGNPVMEKNIERQRNAIAENKDARQYPFTAQDAQNVPRGTTKFAKPPKEAYDGKLTRKDHAKIDEAGQMPSPAAGKTVTVTLNKSHHYFDSPDPAKKDLSEKKKDLSEQKVQLEPPAGLKGIDLTLWKAEQADKAKQAKNEGK